ncbi:FAD-dependent oxidoreductase [Stackebrandtia nassauensis]|uniref:Monooxygenase FAD-binding protein n=1 Tax=Stackebrandtia nassauensis (strain DSM 44728 / CIP 108903 / NRRL B-16338 / NBRC 102104 / LLR-40K-21) TaxID=446470 RepID=D3PZZ7_STANL|nr:FAD-dependent oxidoreductase [Stackebrandtia nassauensis]ADD45526.1 monooxygenase FAD-binding protein [Stackebrandtia nassauensis DSM 44728]
MSHNETATVCVVGGGPAGAMLSLLLARAGIKVTLLEKHEDFLRDFRGDTVHPSTLAVLDQLGLSERFHALPHRKISGIDLLKDGSRSEVANFGRLKVRHPYIAMIPQWDFLDFLTGEAARYPNFTLRMNTRFTDVLTAEGRVRGVTYRGPDGEGSIRAGLVVAADGRHSDAREALGLRARQRGVAIDVVLFRISRRDDDPDERITVRVGGGDILGLIDRGDYWQAFVEIPKGTGIRELRAAGIEAFREQVTRLAPFLADRVGEIASMDSLNFLDVQATRLPRWHVPGALVIGDAAHCMSPVGGVGINLAIQDAVATANLLTEPLLRAQRHGTAPPTRALAAVRRRRALPASVIQVLQDAAIRYDPATIADRGRTSRAGSSLAQRLLGRVIGMGLRPESVRNGRILAPS